MKRLTRILFLALALVPAHGALNTDGLPAGAVAIAGFDFAAFTTTQLGQAVIKAGPINTGNSVDSKLAKDKLGIDIQKDIHAVVLGVYPGADGKVSDKNAQGVILIRGKFDPAKINAAAKDAKVPSTPAGKYQAWEARAFFDAIFGPRPKDDNGEAYLVVTSADLIAIASKDFLDRALTALEKNTKAELLPSEVRAKFAAANGWFFLYADATRAKMKDDTSGINDLTIVLGESATDLQLRIAANFITAEKATSIRKQVKGLQAFEALVGSGVPITQARGQWLEFAGIPLMATFHPNYLLHNPSATAKRTLWEDFLLVMEKLAVPITEKQRAFFTASK